MKTANIVTLLLLLTTNAAIFGHVTKVINNTTIHIIKADITKAPSTYAIDVIVNAANKKLLKGKGVCGAIFEAAEGQSTYLQKFIEENYPNGIETGDAIITPSFDLKNVRKVIHAVGPIYSEYNEKDAAILLKSAYINSLNLAAKNNLKSIAFPFISSAYFGYPKPEAAQIALDALNEYVQTTKNSPIRNIYLVLFQNDDYNLFKMKFGFDDHLKSYLIDKRWIIFSGLLCIGTLAYLLTTTVQSHPSHPNQIPYTPFNWPCF